jgi:hypothetical protein
MQTRHPDGDLRETDKSYQELPYREVTVTHADLTESTNNTAQAINIGAALPAGARVVDSEFYLTTVFSGGSATAVTVDIGGTDTDAIVDGADIFTGSATGYRSGTAGVHRTGSFGGEQLKATFLTDASHNLNGLTAGSIRIRVWFAF